jgi:hypothetical protein
MKYKENGLFRFTLNLSLKKELFLAILTQRFDCKEDPVNGHIAETHAVETFKSSSFMPLMQENMLLYVDLSLMDVTALLRVRKKVAS